MITIFRKEMNRVNSGKNELHLQISAPINVAFYKISSLTTKISAPIKYYVYISFSCRNFWQNGGEEGEVISSTNYSQNFTTPHFSPHIQAKSAYMEKINYITPPFFWMK